MQAWHVLSQTSLLTGCGQLEDIPRVNGEYFWANFYQGRELTQEVLQTIHEKILCLYIQPAVTDDDVGESGVPLLPSAAGSYMSGVRALIRECS